MTEPVLMSFGGFVFGINPSELEIEYERVLSERVIPFEGTEFADLGKRRRKIRGKGFFTGEHSQKAFKGLEAAFSSGETEVLTIPGKGSVPAVLTELRYIGVTAEGVVGYGFCFTEAGREEINGRRKTVKASGGESLWDIAYRYNIPVEELAEKNRHIKYIGLLDEGETVKL